MTISNSKAKRQAQPFDTTRWKVEASCRGLPLAEALASQLLVSPTEAADLIDFGSVYIDGRMQRNPRKPLAGQEEVEIHWPRHGARRFYEIDPKRILFRDSCLLAYDKEAEVPSQQMPSDAYNNLYAAVRRHLERQAKREVYVAMHHRLDRETSGVMLFATDRSVNRKLGKAFQDHAVEKDYLTWVEGCPEHDFWVSTDDIGRQSGRYVALAKGQGKSAETEFRVLLRQAGRSLLRARPKTGRTHQIRLHTAAADHPVIGDRLYGSRTGKKLYLHAYRMSLLHPLSGNQLVLIAPIPAEWPDPHTLTMLE